MTKAIPGEVPPTPRRQIPEVPALARVLTALAEAGDVVRADAMARFKASGGKLDRWGRADVEAMARAFTYVEDDLEIRSTAFGPARRKLRVVRRLLESAAEGGG